VAKRRTKTEQEPDPWPHQEYAESELKKAFAAACKGGPKRVCLVLPTGMGKTWVMRRVAKWVVENGGLASAGMPGRVSVFTNRRILVDQISRGLEDAGMSHALRCAGYPWDHDNPLQVTSTQTDYARVASNPTWWKEHAADLVFFDEAHMQKGKMARQVIRHYADAGALVVGLTATPVGLTGIYETLIQAGNNTQGRACGALVHAVHYGPDEPDLSKIKGVSVGVDLSEEQNKKAMGSVDGPPKERMKLQRLFGRVVEWYRRLNPGQKPTILFAPGVKESVWFAEQFCDRGIPAAHIDGEEVWDTGNRCQSTTQNREAVFERLRRGQLKVLCNRFVLREGIDLPWLEHCVMACVFGSLQSYLQSGGRMLRASPKTGKQRAVVQDHGGNWWRHGSLNADRLWNLDWTETQVGHLSLQKFTDPGSDEPKPFLCPYCSAVMTWRRDYEREGRFVGRCNQCDTDIDFSKRTRPVIQEDGGLTRHGGDPINPVERRLENDTASLWKSIYWRARSAKMTFKAALGLFKREHGYYPADGIPYMPVNPSALPRRVCDVPFDHLVPDPEYAERKARRDAARAARDGLQDVPDLPDDPVPD
jgi:superfamily II DNA or RNA helicase